MTKSIKKLLNPIYLMILLMLAGLLVACDGGTGYDDTTPSATALLPTLNFAGKVQDTNAFIGFALNGAQVMVYICDSQNIVEWLDGQWNGDNLNMTSESGVELQATKDQEAIRGTIKLDGQPLSFEAPLVGDGAGIFRNQETQDAQLLLTGWILLPDGQERGATILTDLRQVRTRLRLPVRGGVTIPAPCARCVRPAPAPQKPPQPTQGRVPANQATPTSGKVIAPANDRTRPPSTLVTPTAIPCPRCIPGGADGLPPLEVDPNGRTIAPATTVAATSKPARVTATPVPVRATATPVRGRATATPTPEKAVLAGGDGNGNGLRRTLDPTATLEPCLRCTPVADGGLVAKPAFTPTPNSSK